MASLRELSNCEKVLKAEKFCRFGFVVSRSVFIWSIENFSMCCQNDDSIINSPEFGMTQSMPAKFSLAIEPKGIAGKEEYICVFLYRACEDNAPEVVFVESFLSIVDADGKLCNIHGSRIFIKKYEGWGFPSFILREEILEKKSEFLPNDTLTLRWEVGVRIEDNQSTERNAKQKEEEISVYESLSHDLKKLCDSGQYSDLTLKLVGEELKLHSVILGARCSVLENVIEAERLKHGVANLDFTDLNPDAVKAFISYLYTGKAHSICYGPLGLYEMACKYDLHELQHIYKPNEFHAETRISVNNCSYTWVIENFSSLKHSIDENVLKASFLPQGENFDLLFQQKCQNREDDDVSVFLCRLWCDSEEKAVSVKFKVSIVDANNELQHTATLNQKFEMGEKFGFCPFIKRDMLFKEENNLLPNNTLTLQCDISVSDGTHEFSDAEEVFLRETSVGFTDDHLKKLGEDLEALYKSKKLTDITIRMKHDEFHVHKVILMARSPVFCGMFSCEMAEKKTNVIEITDIEPHIIEIMLQYIYSGQLKNVNMDNAVELYSASDKYQLLDMKAKCCTYFLSSLTIDNVCDMLIIADMYTDNELKLAAKKYFCSNACDIMETSKWQNILKDNVLLASEVLQFHSAYYDRIYKAIRRDKCH
ncbi:Speckle-type POZ protein, partial [Stegodyphus mimosarum]